MKAAGSPRFMVDHNVGKLARWLRMMGYDARFFKSGDDSAMIAAALAEGRVILTRDTRISKRRLVVSGQLKVIVFETDRSEGQICQLIEALGLDSRFRPFTLCLECNQPLAGRAKQQLKDRLPPYVYKTQQQYMECPVCRRIYWRGTHWQAMKKKLDEFSRC